MKGQSGNSVVIAATVVSHGGCNNDMGSKMMVCFSFFGIKEESVW